MGLATIPLLFQFLLILFSISFFNFDDFHDEWMHLMIGMDGDLFWSYILHKGRHTHGNKLGDDLRLLMDVNGCF